MTTKKAKIVCDPYDSEFGADAIKPEDFSDLTKARREIRKKHGGKHGGKAKQRKAHDLIRKWFIDDLFYAHDEKPFLPKEFASRLERIVVNDWLGSPLPAGRHITYTPKDRTAFVNKVDALYEAGGKTKEEAINLAGEELWPNDKHKRPNSGRYYTWKKACTRPNTKSESAQKNSSCSK